MDDAHIFFYSTEEDTTWPWLFGVNDRGDANEAVLDAMVKEHPNDIYFYARIEAM